MDIDEVSLRKGAEDFRYLVSHGYPRQKSLELIGNRYRLRKDHRDLLHRGVFSQELATTRRKKLLGIDCVEDSYLAVDGYNVLITVETALKRKPLVVADDGLIRDISGVSSAYKMQDVTLHALDLITEILGRPRPKGVVFLFDSPISKSGRLAGYVTDRLRAAGFAGRARAVKVPERILLGYHGLIATSDSAIIDSVERVVDLAGHVIRNLVTDPWLIEL
jgi:hypothetical protein